MFSSLRPCGGFAAERFGCQLWLFPCNWEQTGTEETPNEAMQGHLGIILTPGWPHHHFTDIYIKQLPGRQPSILSHRCFDMPKMAPFPPPPQPPLVPGKPICKSPPFLKILNPLLLPARSLGIFFFFNVFPVLKITDLSRQPCSWIFSTRCCEILIDILKMC